MEFDWRLVKTLPGFCVQQIGLNGPVDSVAKIIFEPSRELAPICGKISISEFGDAVQAAECIVNIIQSFQNFIFIVAVSSMSSLEDSVDMEVPSVEAAKSVSVLEHWHLFNLKSLF